MNKCKKCIKTNEAKETMESIKTVICRGYAVHCYCERDHRCGKDCPAEDDYKFLDNLLKDIK